MIGTGIDVRVKIQDIVSSQLPEYVISESPLTDDFLKQFYVSQEFQGGAVDFASNLDQYLSLDTYTENVVFDNFILTESIDATDTVVHVNTTKGFPNEYGLLKVDSEIMSYTGVTTNTFTGVIRGFSGIVSYTDPKNPGEAYFEQTIAEPHLVDAEITNLSTLFLKEFYNSLKSTFSPGFENIELAQRVEPGTWIRQARSFYQSKGSEESIIILFKVLFGEVPTVLDLENFLIKSSDADFTRRDFAVATQVQGNPIDLRGRTVFQSNSTDVSGAVSEIEPFTRDGQLLYKINLYVADNEIGQEKKQFTVPGRTFCQRIWNQGDPTITVDTTIGFRDNGEFITADGTKFTYTEKSVNQFLGVVCEDPLKTIAVGEEIVDDIFIFGRGLDGKEVKLRLTGTLSDIDFGRDGVPFSSVGENIQVDSLGENILPPAATRNVPTYADIVANSFIYNTSVRFQVGVINGTSFEIIAQYLDDSYIRVNDTVDILVRGSDNVILSNRLVTNVSYESATITVDDSFGIPPNTEIDIRRNQKYASSTSAPIKYGNDNILSNVQNLYDAFDYDGNFYVATNSLPSYDIETGIVESVIQDIAPSNLEDFNSFTGAYSTIVFPVAVEFITGDLVTYAVLGDADPICETGEYFIEVLPDPKKVRLYVSPSFIGGTNFVELVLTSSPGDHIFTLESQKNRLISPQNIFRKIPVSRGSQNITIDRLPQEILAGEIAVLTNGVVVDSYISADSIYLGPLDSIDAVSGGEGYSPITPPQISVADPTIQVKTQIPETENPPKALATPVVKARLEKILIDPQDFDIDKVFSISVTGGNSGGASAIPQIERRKRDVQFDSRTTVFGGGIEPSEDSIQFLVPHNFTRGEKIVYNNKGSESIGVSGPGSNFASGRLANGGIYFASPINNLTIQIFNSLEDLIAGTTPVSLSANQTGFGIQSFDTLSKNTLTGATITEDGGDFFYRSMKFSPTNVFIEYDEIRYDNHGFSTGDVVEYRNEGTSIGGLSTITSYFLVAPDENTIKLCDAGIGATSTYDYDRLDFVDLTSVGVGTHTIKYEDITADVVVSFASTNTGQVVATPFLRGEIDGVYVDEGGFYGSDILNFEKNPQIDVVTGTRAKANPIISLGRVIGIQILAKGRNYQSTPDLTVVDPTGNGSGAILRAVVEDGEIVDIIIIKPGIGYDPDTSSIEIVDPGKNGLLIPRIRRLRYNKQARFGFESLEENEYSVVSYGRKVRVDVYGDVGINHSPIIGWANDGNPIYGGFGLDDPQDQDSDIRALTTAYDLDVDATPGRPSELDFPAGIFISDYVFTGEGDLDQYNGRYCRTPDFPNGVYAYFAGISSDTTSLERAPEFPYFVGPEFRDAPATDETGVPQSFNLNDKQVYRNTQPYAVGSPTVGSEFLVQSYLYETQETSIESIQSSNVSFISVVGAGRSYVVGDVPQFDQSEDVLSSVVSDVVGKEVVSIGSSIIGYGRTDVRIVKQGKSTVKVYVDPQHVFLDKDTVIFNGLSTSLSPLTEPQLISVNNESMSLYSPVEPELSFDGFADIFVNTISSNVEIGSELNVGIGSTVESVKVLNIFPVNKALRVRREQFTTEHLIGTPITVTPDAFEINASLGDIDSFQDETYFFNPQDVVAVGLETGVSQGLVYSIGNINYNISVPNGTIYAPNHGFRDNEPILIRKDPNDVSLVARASDSLTAIPLPDPVTNETEVIVSKISKDLIGIKTTANTPPVFFTGAGVDSPYYSIKTIRPVERANVNRIQAVVTTVEPHQINNQDKVSVTVKSSSTSGIGSNPNIFLQFDDISQSLIIDPLFASPSDVDINNNIIKIDNHDFVTGDYVLYENEDSPITGLTTHQKYFVIAFDTDRFLLAETEADIKTGSVNPIDLESIGIGTHKFSKVNPRIAIIKNNNIEFDISDPSLFGKELNFYYDQQQTEIFESNGVDKVFVVSGVSTAGYPDATKTIRFSEDNPVTIYYGVSEGGYISTSDPNANGYNSINYTDSTYSITARATKNSETQFSFSLPNLPESSLYSAVSSDISYITSSRTALGGVGRVRILSSGKNFTSSPEFLTIDSKFGINGSLRAESSTIGKVASIRIKNPGWGYSADNTLRPKGIIQPKITFTDSDFVTNIDIVDAGSGYQNAPNPVLVDAITRDVIDNGSIELEVQSSSISEVLIDVAPSGMAKNLHELYTINNSNGIPINLINGINPNTGIVSFTIQTPIFGYSQQPFEVGDQVFVENIITDRPDEESFLNSADYGYRFFDVIGVTPSNPITVVIQYPEDAIGKIGAGSTFQNAFSSMVNRNIYPTFNVIQATAIFNVGERLSYIDPQGNVFETDLVVSESNTNFFKVNGSFDVLVGDSYKGQLSGVEVTVSSVENDQCRYIVDSVSRINTGWQNEVGFLNTELQVTANNDYYQNLSYSIKSTKTYEEIIGPVNTLVHPSGLKNFADTKLESSGFLGIGATSATEITLDFVGLTDVSKTPLRVDRINNFDLGYDNEVNNNRSSSIRFNSRTSNKRLTDFVEVRTNRVLLMDDISSGFIDSDNARGQDLFTDFDIITGDFTRGVLQVRDPFTDGVELIEIVVLAYNNNAYTLQKAAVSSQDEGYGEFIGVSKNSTEYTLRFTNFDIEEQDLDLKLLSNKFIFDSDAALPLGNSVLGGVNESLENGDTKRIYAQRDGEATALYVQIINQRGEPSYYEYYTVECDGDTFSAVYSFDSSSVNAYNAEDEVVFSSNVDAQGRLNVFAQNTSGGKILLTTKSTSFNSVSDGDPIYRFKRESIADGDERSVDLISNRTSGTATDASIDIITESASLFQSLRTLVLVKGDDFAALHQVMTINSDGQTYTTAYPFLTQGEDLDPSAGIGSFGSVLNGDDFTLQFYPDAGLSGPVELTSYNEAFYREYDSVNYRNLPLRYSESEENYYLRQYVAPLGKRSDKVEFELTYQGVPIYEKTFVPQTVISQVGPFSVFTINDHFFSQAEGLYYEAGSSVTTVEPEPLEITPVVDYRGITTSTMPDSVWVIKRDLNTFQLAPTQDDANDPEGSRIQVVGFGSGNAHVLGMVKKLEKTLITIDGVIQAPIVTANKFFELDVAVNDIEEVFTLSGIGSIASEDILKIGEEYVRLKNVGFGTQNGGPIDNTGNVPLIEVQRGIVGSISTSHAAGSPMALYRGSFNIVDSSVFFTEAPSGRGDAQLNQSNLVEINSSFQGRTFLQREYDQIALLDDISDSFDGDTNTFTLTSAGSSIGAGRTFGEIENGSGVLIINDIYQTPTTDNNEGNNYFYEYNENTGENTVVFTGIVSTNGQRVTSEFDVNQNQIPRGGLIVSVGSTPGLGYAPLYGAILQPIVVGGEITGVESTNVIGTTTNVQFAEYDPITGMLVVAAYGLDSSPTFNVTDALYFKESGTLFITPDAPLNGDIEAGSLVVLDGLEFSCTNSISTVSVSTATYDPSSGLVEIETTTPNNISEGQSVKIENLVFECDSGGGLSTQFFPSGANGFDFVVSDVLTESRFITNVGTSTLPHTYVSSGEVTVGITTTIFPEGDTSYIVQGISDGNKIVVNVGFSTIDHTYVGGGTVVGKEPFQFNTDAGNPDFVYLDGLQFACPGGQTAGLTTTIFPVPGEEGFPFVSKVDDGHFEVFVGLSTINHTYVSGGVIGKYTKNNPGSGYIGEQTIIAYEEGHTGVAASIRGIPGPGGELSFVIDNPGSGYSEPQLSAPDPAYENLPVIGYSRRLEDGSIGLTTITGKNLFVTVEVGAATTTAIGRSEFFEVSNFELTNQGYSFLPGDVIEVVGIPTDKNLSQPIAPFQITVTDTFSDNFSAWNFGETDYIDSIAPLQDGVRTRFPLTYKGETLAFEKNLNDEDSAAIDLSSILLIYVNTVLQVPDVNYTFDGGTSFEFTRAPFKEDDIDVYFYRGKRNVDSIIVTDVNESIRPGDQLQMKKNNAIAGTKTQDIRTVTDIAASDTVRTNTYFGRGDLDTVNEREVAWDKQKRDVFIYGEVYTKIRDGLEPIIKPRGSIIRDVKTLDEVIYLDSAEFFNYEEDVPGSPIVLANLDARMYRSILTDQVPATATANVQSNGQLSAVLTIVDDGSGYATDPDITIAPPADPNGTRAGNVSVNLSSIDGSINSASVGNRGSGYDPNNPPIVLIGPHSMDYEDVLSITSIQGFSGIITAIEATSGTGAGFSKGIRFSYRVNPGTVAAELQAGDSVSVVNTVVGNGVISQGNSNSSLERVGVSTEYVDCIYQVALHVPLSFVGYFEVNVSSGTNISGIDIAGEDLGQFSWGKIGVVRNILDDPRPDLDIDGSTFTREMQNYPTLVRTSGGLRDQGGIAKRV